MIDRFAGKYDWLSNMYPCVIEYEGLVFTSTEAAYQAMKTLDLKQRQLFTTYNGKTSKNKAAKLEIRKDWNDIKETVMLDVLNLKFADPELKQKLLDTGDEEIIEGNYWHDNFWGSCTCSKCGNVGKNILGKQLMKMRLYFQVVGE